MFQRLNRGGWPYGYPPVSVPFDVNWESEQSDGLVLWMPWGGGTPGAHSQHVDRIRGLAFTEGGTPVWTSDGERGWSMLFNDGANDHLSVASVPVTGYPFTMMARVYSDDMATNQGSMGLYLSAPNFDYIGLQINAALAGDPLNFIVRDPPATIHCRTTTGFSANTWYHCCGVAKAANDRASYINGGSKGTSAVATTITWDTTHVGRVGTFYMSGRLMDVRIYNRALTDTQVYQMYAANPWELWRPRIRRLGARYPVVARIPRPPAAYNTLMIY